MVDSAVKDFYAISLLQAEILFRNLHLPRVGTDIAQLVCTFSDIDLPSLERAWRTVWLNNESLQVGFSAIESRQPLQGTQAGSELSWSVLDWRDTPNGTQSNLEEFLHRDRLVGFNLMQPPLMRLTLIHYPAQSFRLVLTFQRALFDHASLPALFRQVAETYQAYIDKKDFESDPAPSYRDYVDWLEKQDWSDAKNYWWEKLRGNLNVIQLGMSRFQLLAENQPYYDMVNTEIAPDITDTLTRFTEENSLTLDILLQSAWAILLYRYSGEQEVLFGATRNLRASILDDQNFKETIGLFTNSLPLRIQVNPEAPAARILEEMRAHTLELKDSLREHFALTEVQKLAELQPEENIFNSLLTIESNELAQSLRNQHAVLANWEFELFKCDGYPLSMTIYTGQRIKISLEYSRELFDTVTAKRILDHFQILLKGIVDDPSRAVWELPLLTSAERRTLLEKWDATKRYYPPDQCVHELFERQANQTPDSVAVTFENQGLTYRTLNQKANQLAHYLRAHGVNRETIVALYLDRSLEMIVAILGILKAGGGYLPIDPVYPPERVAFMLEDSQTPFLITQTARISDLPTFNGPTLCLDTQWEMISAYPSANPTKVNAPNDLAYVIYTSGSTGKPKGALVTHYNVVRLFQATDAWYRFDANDVWTMFHSYAFDFSVWEIWGALLYGGRVIVIPYAVSRSPEIFHRLLVNEGVTVLNQTPSAFYQLISADEVSKHSAELKLRYVIFGGEALDLQALRPWFNRHDDRAPQLVNMYGITETTVHVTYRPITRDDLDAQFGSVVGVPIPDLQIYLLDAYRQLCPSGVTGEIYVGGAGVARGYLNRPELTAERFIPNPFGEGRLYKAGDLARYLPNGDMEYLGRMDHQVKIRGFRVELGEIESALSSQPTIDQAVVVLKDRSLGGKQLVAYIKPASQKADDATNSEHIRLWQNLYEQTYSRVDAADMTLNISGWDSSYTNAPYPKEEMQEWVEETVERIMELHPRSTLELGCGTGLLLTRIAPHCEKYVGVDFSETVIRRLERMCTQIEDLRHVSLLNRLADDFSGFEENQFDTIIINSVVQYFPDREYFERVISGALKVLKPQGRIFIGDVRHYGLIGMFHASVQLYQAVDGLPIQQLKNRIWQYQRQDKELLIAPEFFIALAQTYPRIRRVQAVPKYGKFENEMNRFRYDVTLRAGQTTAVQKEIVWHDWQTERLNLDALKDLLDRQTQPIGFRRVPNARLFGERYAQRWLANEANASATVAEYRKEFSAQHNDGVSVNRLREIASGIGWQLELNWLSTTDGDFDAVFMPPGFDQEIQFADLQSEIDVIKSINVPIQKSNMARLISEWRSTLRERLPDYMVPSAFVVLDEFPLTPNGKIDRKALPEPDSAALVSSTDFVPPQNQIEQTLAEIWIDLLGLSQVGRNDNFFELGGDSILSIQFVSRAQSKNLYLTPLQVFQSPTITELAQIAKEYEPVRIEQNLVLKNQSELDAELQHLTARGMDVVDVYPLSPMQSGMLFHTLYASNSGVYFIQMTFQIDGDLDVHRFRQAWQQVTNRHTILRTSFEWQGLSEPLQIVHRQVDLPWEELDWRGLSSTEQASRFEDFLQREREKGFDLNRAPLIKCTLIRSGESHYQFVWHCHHILTDGWSVEVMFKEVFDFYENKAALLPVAHPYRDYIVWLAQQDANRAQTFWREQLSDFSAPTPLGVDQPQPHDGHQTYHVEFSSELTAHLTRFARQNHLTLNTIFQGAYALMLKRYSGEAEVLFGVTVNGRAGRLKEIEERLGPFLNTLPLRVKFPEYARLIPWLEELQRANVAQTEYAYTPLVEIQKQSGVPAGMPLFESALVFENYPLSEWMTASPGNLHLSEFRVLDRTNFPLLIDAFYGERFALSFSYDLSRFDQETIQRMAGHLQTLMEAMVINPELPVTKLSMLTEAERQQLLIEWNDTQTEYPQDKCVQDLFEEQVERTPDAIAAIFENQQLTYRELNRRANQLAHYLQKLGVGPDALVGIYIERSLEMLIGLLGILKAGGAYVPIDPAYPQERKKYIAEDSQIAILLTQEHLTAGEDNIWGKDQARSVICLDRDWSKIAEEADTNPQRATTPDHLAYVIYTSGSTGKPKGAMIVQRGLTNYLNWCLHAYPIRAGSGTPVHSSLSFDLTVTSIYPALLAGQPVWLLREDLGVEALNWMMDAERNFSLIKITPAHLRLLNEQRQSKDAAGRTHAFIIGGENLYAEQVNFWLEHAPQTALVNEYGPTETVVGCCVYTIPQGTKPQGVIPIGRPIDNTQLYVLDEDLQLLPIGVAGELYIGGVGVARGYLNRPELTAEKFIRDPFNPEPGRYLYKTGDRVRWLPDGNLEFLGRLDFQVKIRGYRIELGEIESVLEQYPVVEQAVVVAQRDTAGENQLVAYVALKNKDESSSSLRDYLKQKLPDYMIPGFFMQLERIPLTPNGKVDRKALPAPSILRQADASAAPRTPLEKRLADIWTEVLGVENPGLHDNFFDLGGHSLLALRLFSRLRETLGLELSLRMLFETPTISELSKQIENIIWAARQTSQSSGGDADPYEEISL